MRLQFRLHSFKIYIGISHVWTGNSDFLQPMVKLFYELSGPKFVSKGVFMWLWCFVVFVVAAAAAVVATAVAVFVVVLFHPPTPVDILNFDFAYRPTEWHW